MYRHFNRVSCVDSGNYIYSWKSKGLSDENITAPTTSDYKRNAELSYFGKTRVEFNGSCLKQNKVTFNHGKVVNIYIVYEINDGFLVSGYPRLENCLFEAKFWLKMLISIGTNILDMGLDFIGMEFFHFLVLD